MDFEKLLVQALLFSELIWGWVTIYIAVRELRLKETK